MASTQVFLLPNPSSTSERPHPSRMSSWAAIKPLIGKLIRLSDGVRNWELLSVTKTISEAIVSTRVYGSEQDPEGRIYITIRILIGSFY